MQQQQIPPPNTVNSAVNGAVAPSGNQYVTTGAAVLDDDPFITDNAMDTREDGGDPNASSVLVLDPSRFVEPTGPPAISYFAITVGQPIGVIADLSTVDLNAQVEFAFRHFPTWLAAMGYYTISYHSQQVRLVPAIAPGLLPVNLPPLPAPQAPPMQIAGHSSSAMRALGSALVSTRAADPRPLPAPQAPPVQSVGQGSSATLALGSALNPIRLDSPSFILSALTANANSTSPTPAPRKVHTLSADKGKSVASTAPRQVRFHNTTRSSAATRVRRKQKQTATNDSSETTIIREVIVHGSDSDVEGLPSYPKIPTENAALMSSSSGSANPAVLPTVGALSNGNDVFLASGPPAQSSSMAPLTTVTVHSDSDDETLAVLRAAQQKRAKRGVQQTTKRPRYSAVLASAGAAPTENDGTLTTGGTTHATDISTITSSRLGSGSSGHFTQRVAPLASGASVQSVVPPPSAIASIQPATSLQSPINLAHGPTRRFPQTPGAAATTASSVQPSDLGATAGVLAALDADSSLGLPATSPLTPAPNQRRFEVLFPDSDVGPEDQIMDGSDSVEDSEWASRWLRSNITMRYRITPAGRRQLGHVSNMPSSSLASRPPYAESSLGANASVAESGPSEVSAIATVASTSTAANASTAIASTAAGTSTATNASTAIASTAAGTSTAATTSAAAASSTAEGASTAAAASTASGMSTTAAASTASGVSTAATASTAPGVSTAAGASNEVNNIDGSEMGDTDYGMSDLEADFMAEVGPLLDAIYIPAVVQDPAPQGNQ